MIKTFDKNTISIPQIVNRSIADYKEFDIIVDNILEDVKKRGDIALREYALKFENAELSSIIVSSEEIEEGIKIVDKKVLIALERAKDNIIEYHKKQVKSGFKIEKNDGIILGQRYNPIESAGLYVPGGTASYPSSVLMNAIPAKIAGVKNIVMATPVGSDGKVNPVILAAAKMAGVDMIIKCGGAQAIGAMTFGTQTIPKVDKIVGPGNIFVTLAKKKVFGTVGIDGIAGPSEILIIADSTANAKFVAADMLSQAEHDILATSVLITTDRQLASAVSNEIEIQLSQTPREFIARKSIELNGKIIICDTIDECIEISDQIAPEHLEICCENPFEILEKINNAGSVFLGNYCPEPLGDYYAGTNHVLPTNGNAKFASALSVDDFVKKTSYLYYTKEALLECSEDVMLLAKSEGLYAHGNAIKVRTPLV